MAVALLVAATSLEVFAQETSSQAWVPETLEMPEDIEIRSERAIGSSLRMLSFTTAADVDELLEGWTEALELGGYTVLAAEVENLNHVIEFSGQGIANGKIVVTPSEIEGRSVIQMDATLS